MMILTSRPISGVHRGYSQLDKLMNYCHVEFSLQMIDPFHAHEFNGSMIRGTLMQEVRELVCTTSQSDCSGCPVAEECVYHRLFEPQSNDADSHTRGQDVPRPFVIDSTNIPNQTFHTGDSISFSITLLGRALAALPFFVYAIHRMGERGFGLHRARFRLREVRDRLNRGSLIFTDQDRELLTPEAAPLLIDDPISVKPERIRIRLLTPFFTKSRKVVVREPDFYHFIRVGVTRLELLHRYFADGEFPWPARDLIRQARDVQRLSHTYHWQGQKRYSSRQDLVLKIGGVVGDAIFQGDLAPFMPVLRALKIAHLGKSAAFGLGKIDVTVMQPASVIV